MAGLPEITTEELITILWNAECVLCSLALLIASDIVIGCPAFKLLNGSVHVGREHSLIS